MVGVKRGVVGTSFFLYLMPSGRQDTALVTAGGGLGAASSLYPSWAGSGVRAGVRQGWIRFNNFLPVTPRLFWVFEP